MNRGRFITVEGIEGVGKSSNIDVLVKHIENAGYEVLSTREPGGTPLAEDIPTLATLLGAAGWDTAAVVNSTWLRKDSFKLTAGFDEYLFVEDRPVDAELLRRSLDDVIVTPARAGLIPGCTEVIDAARTAGALGSSISGAGPSVFALCESQRVAAEAAAAMRVRFEQAGLPATAVVSPADCPGARAL